MLGGMMAVFHEHHQGPENMLKHLSSEFLIVSLLVVVLSTNDTVVALLARPLIFSNCWRVAVPMVFHEATLN